MDYPTIVVLLVIQELINIQQVWSKRCYKALRSLGRGYSSRFEERSELEDENLIYPQKVRRISARKAAFAS